MKYKNAKLMFSKVTGQTISCQATRLRICNEKAMRKFVLSIQIYVHSEVILTQSLAGLAIHIFNPWARFMNPRVLFMKHAHRGGN